MSELIEEAVMEEINSVAEAMSLIIESEDKPKTRRSAKRGHIGSKRNNAKCTLNERKSKFQKCIIQF